MGEDHTDNLSKSSAVMRWPNIRLAVMALILTSVLPGCHRGEPGLLRVENKTGRDLFLSWTITPKDSIAAILVAPREDSLHLDLLNDGEGRTVPLPPGYAASDRIAIRLYSLDAGERPGRYRLESLTLTSVGDLEVQDWKPVVIKNIASHR